MEKEKSTDEPQKPFTEKGQRDDEVELVFKDEQKLYVSRNFLSYASPVFEAMFSHDFIEKQEKKVNLKSKEYEDFLEFLLCVHPRILKAVDESNVLRIIPIAEEYQVQSIVSRCRTIMKSWVDRSVSIASGKQHVSDQIPYCRVCFRILEVVNMLSYEDDVAYLIDRVARFGYDLLFTGRNYFEKGSQEYTLDKNFHKEVLRDVRKEYIAIFERLPVEMKYRILKKRLNLMDDNRFIK